MSSVGIQTLPGWKANKLTTEPKCDHTLASAQYFTWRCDNTYGLFLRNILYTDLHWILPLCALLWSSITHYDITMGNDVAKYTHCNITMGNDVDSDIHCDVTMSNDITMCTSQCIITLLWTSLVMYYYTHLCYCCFTTKPFTIVHINH